VTTYDEFGLFKENADEAVLPWRGQPTVRREAVDVPGGRLSALVWGDGSPDIVFLHGGAQNAHTWDTVALALDRPMVCLDLPGHGHSGWWDAHDYSPTSMAPEVAVAIRQLAPAAAMVVGMSLGGLTALCLAASYPELVPRLVVIDVTPGTDHAKAEPIVAFVSGPETFATFEEILARTIEFNPTRSESSLRRGVLHNARPQPDGTWVWRYDRVRSWRMDAEDAATPDFSGLWSAVDAVKAPLLFVRGGVSGVVGDEDVAELVRRQPSCRVIVVEGAGHSIQGDRPVELAGLLSEFLETSG
jgi:pimeloyl-ACP methyl ester carboxylesterase